ncbi:MAG: TolC family protein [Bacteroidetes bacterium]|nr:TolC family protein [Bacteroidota bacterium]
MRLVNIHIQLIFLFIFEIGVQSAHAQIWTIQQCIDTAKVHNKSLQMGYNNIAIGKQKSKEVKANFIPKLTANTDYKYFTNLPYQLLPLSTFSPSAPEGQFKEAQFGVPHNINANLQLSVPFYNPQIYGTIQTSKIALELTELQFKKTEEELYFEITNLYYNAQYAHQQMVFIDGNITNAQKLLLNMQLLLEQKLTKGTDVIKVKLQVAQLMNQKENISSKYQQVLNVLKFSMGLSLDHQILIDTVIQFQNTVEHTVASTLDMRIIKTQNRLLSSEINTLSNTRTMPTINFISLFGTSGFGYDKQPNDFLKFYPIGYAGIQISYPIFSGTTTQRKLNQKKLELQNNKLQFDANNDQNNMQIENTKMQRSIAQKSMETIINQVELATTIYNQTILLQKQGEASLTDIILADNALRESQQTYLSAIIDYLKADLELKKITGNISSLK